MWGGNLWNISYLHRCGAGIVKSNASGPERGLLAIHAEPAHHSCSSVSRRVLACLAYWSFCGLCTWLLKGWWLWGWPAAGRQAPWQACLAGHVRKRLGGLFSCMSWSTHYIDVSSHHVSSTIFSIVIFLYFKATSEVVPWPIAIKSLCCTKCQ